MRERIRATAGLTVAVVAIVAGVRLMLRLPGVPYNVRELFLDNASLTALVFFALTVIWIGVGARLVAHVTTRSGWPAMVVPLAVVVVSLISKMLVSRAVTYESLDDILGSNNLFGLVVDHNVWGPAWRGRFLALGVDTIDFLERRVRYCALYSIPSLWTAIAFATLAPTTSRWHSAIQHAFALIVALAWTWLCGTIVLTWAATDNLTELIAPSGPLGIAGPMWLLALVIVLAVNAALLTTAARSAGRALMAGIVTASCVPLTWWLVNAGLEQHVQKYGFTFPATTFLLGPDRQHALSTSMLFARWAALYVAAVLAIAVGGGLFGALAVGGVSTSKSASTARAAS